jgi:hypothetical protein
MHRFFCDFECLATGRGFPWPFRVGNGVVVVGDGLMLIAGGDVYIANNKNDLCNPVFV